MKPKEMKVLRYLSLLGIIAAILYISHVIAGRILWSEYNPFSQPISDLTAKGAISQPVASVISKLYGLVDMAFSVVMLIYFKKARPISKLFYFGVILKGIVSFLSAVGYSLFPLADTTWGNNFQNTMHYTITGVIVFASIIAVILMTIALFKNKQHIFMKWFMLIYCIIFISSGFLTVVAANEFPSYAGLLERINLYSMQIANVILAIWMFKGLSLSELLHTNNIEG